MIALLFYAALIAFLVMSALWLVQRKTCNAGIVDVGWSGTIPVIVIFYFVALQGYQSIHGILALVMALLWGFRLAWHIHKRAHGKPEDARYTDLRQAWGQNFQWKIFVFFQVQAVAAVIFSMPFLIPMLKRILDKSGSAESLAPVEIAGLAIWMLAWRGEIAADRQLNQFKRDPANKGKVCEAGWWNYSRHPNYFFEWLIWVGLAVFCWSSPFGAIALVCPLLMLFFLFKLTGIPATEEQALKSKGDVYRHYQQTTSAFVPWFKKRSDMWYLPLLRQGLIPDTVTRAAIRGLLRDRLKQEQELNRKFSFIESMKTGPLAIHTSAANEQHYEVPTEFYLKVLGHRLKYSSCLYSPEVRDLDGAELAMLDLTVGRAGIVDGMDVLELGCGWGSLSLYMAARFPESNITAISNSRTQKDHIDTAAKKQGLTNLTVITCDMNDFQAPGHYDRIVSVEMFEHMRNYELLLQKVAGWLKPGGRLFVHIFVHDQLAYPFETGEENDWMARYFFTGGLMPSFDVFTHFPKHLAVEQAWAVNGQHYEKTLNAWLEKMDGQRRELTPLFQQTYGKDWKTWWVYWRLFFMACAELFGFHRGREWYVGHYLLKPA